MATEKQWEQLTREGTAILNNPLAEIERLNTRLREAREDRDAALEVAEQLNDESVRHANQRDEAALRAEAAEGRLSRHECICGGPSMQPCGSKCRYPLADEALAQRGAP